MFSFPNKSHEFKVHGVDVEITTLGGVRIHTKNPDEAKIIHKCQIYPKAEAMIRLVEAKKIKVVSAEDALPIYVRNQVAHVAKKGV